MEWKIKCLFINPFWRFISNKFDKFEESDIKKTIKKWKETVEEGDSKLCQ